MPGLKTFLEDDAGALSVEFSFWIPFMCMLLVAVADYSFLYLSQNEMWTVARDTARRITSAQDDAQAAEDWANAQLAVYRQNYSVDVTWSTDFVQVVIATPVSGIVPFGIFASAFFSEDVIAKVIMRKPADLDPTPSGGGGGGPKK